MLSQFRGQSRAGFNHWATTWYQRNPLNPGLIPGLRQGPPSPPGLQSQEEAQSMAGCGPKVKQAKPTKAENDKAGIYMATEASESSGHVLLLLCHFPWRWVRCFGLSPVCGPQLTPNGQLLASENMPSCSPNDLCPVPHNSSWLTAPLPVPRNTLCPRDPFPVTPAHNKVGSLSLLPPGALTPTVQPPGLPSARDPVS